MFRVIAALAAENHRAGKIRVPELPVRTFASGHEREPRLLNAGDQLANLSWHTPKLATTPAGLPIPVLQRGKNTSPELRVRSLLHRLGFRFRLHVRIGVPSNSLST